MQINQLKSYNNPAFGMKYEIIPIKNVEQGFVNTISKSIETLPDTWANVLEKNKYKLYCSDSIQDTFEHVGIQEKAPNLDAVTRNNSIFKFFVFTPKIEIPDIQKVVNHEISHGIVNSERLTKNGDLIFAVCEDVVKFPVVKLSECAQYAPQNLLRANIDEYGINEIFADILAWLQKGGGLWGSGYKNELNNPNFLKENFPNTYEKISQYEVGAQK